MASITGHEKYTESICWHCENYTKCNWGRYDKKKCKVNFGAVRGWKVKHERGGITVIDCPEYIEDERHRKERVEANEIQPKEAYIVLEKRKDELRNLTGYTRRKMIRKIYRDAGLCSCGKPRANGRRSCELCAERQDWSNAKRRMMLELTEEAYQKAEK